jgi:oxygen-dependent protoporphyrinogen oxidase
MWHEKNNSKQKRQEAGADAKGGIMAMRANDAELHVGKQERAPEEPIGQDRLVAGLATSGTQQTAHRNSLLGRLHPAKPVVIIGGGVSGLLAAWYARRAGYQVELYESSQRLGGLIDTIVTPHGPAETAAHSLLMTPAVAELFEQLGLKTQSPMARARYIFRDGACRRFPLKLTEFLVLLVRFILVPLKLPTTLENFGRRHLGAAGLRYLFAPAMTGIFAGNLSTMSATAALPMLRFSQGMSLFFVFLLARLRGAKRKKTHSQNQSSSSRGMVALDGGTVQLTRALEQSIKENGVKIHTGKTVTDLTPWFASVERAETNLILCTPAPVAADLLDSVSVALGHGLRSVEYVPLITITAFYETKGLTRFTPGVGVLVPRGQGVRALGVLYNSASFLGRVNDPGNSSFTVMYGGALDPDALSLSDDQLSEQLKTDMALLLGATQDPVHRQVTRWPRAIPHHTAELEALWSTAERDLPDGLLLFGNYTGQVSLRGMIETLSLNFEPKE